MIGSFKARDQLSLTNQKNEYNTSNMIGSFKAHGNFS